MNEFPAKYKEVFSHAVREPIAGLNGTEYLEFLENCGLKEESYKPIQPVSQGKIWEFMDKYYKNAADEAIEKAKKKYPGFNLDKASWTNDRNWVKGYEGVLGPINELSVEFHKRFKGKNEDEKNSSYRQALLYLLLSQTSCFRYWGEGIWTEYAKEICRRGRQVLKKI